MAQSVTVDRQFVVKTFTTLAQIPSPLLQVAGVMKYLELLLKGWGIGYRFDQVGVALAGFQCGNLIADVIPATPGCEALPVKGVEAHVDTVSLPPGVNSINVVVEEGTIRSDGRTILGADDKAGVTAIIVALAYILKHRLPHGPIQLLFTVGEERSMYGVRELDLSWVLAATVVSVDGLEGSKLWRGCPAKLKYRATFKGHAGHAAFPEDTLHAGLMANLALSGVMTAGLLGGEGDWGILRGSCLEQTVFHNVSQITTTPAVEFPATNVVPGEATVCGEFRSFSKEQMGTCLRTLQNICQVAATNSRSCNRRHQGQVTFETEYPYEPFSLPSGIWFVQDMVRAMSAAGITDADADLGPGATHANVFNQRGIPALVLGAGGRHAHQNEEHVVIEEMAKAAEVLVHYLTAV